MIDLIQIKQRTLTPSVSEAEVCHLGTSSLIQDDVYDASGNFLGEIEEIILDVRTGGVRHVVLALGGFLGMGRKHIAVPWHAIAPDANYRRCVLDVTLAQLMAVPVSRDDPWLQRAEPPTAQQEIYALRRQFLVAIPWSMRRLSSSKRVASEPSSASRASVQGSFPYRARGTQDLTSEPVRTGDSGSAR